MPPNISWNKEVAKTNTIVRSLLKKGPLNTRGSRVRAMLAGTRGNRVKTMLAGTKKAMPRHRRRFTRRAH